MTESLRIAGHVLPGGEQTELFVVDGRITFEAIGEPRTVSEGGWILPGLVDAHAHLAMSSPGGATPEERVRASARQHLEAGVLAIREPGGPDDASAGFGPEEDLPRVLSAGRFLSAPDAYIPGLAEEVSPEELPKASGRRAEAGLPWVKIIADWMGASGVAPTFPAEVLRAAVDAAHAGGARVAAHATLDATVRMAVEAGVDSIEHGTFATEETMELLAERGTALVPTMLANDSVPAVAAQHGAPPAMLDAIRSGIEAVPAALRRAAALGVTILAGTDAGLGPHGLVAEEIWRLRLAGLDTEASIAAGSWAARTYLGLPGIEADAPADLVVYAEDPRTDLETLRRPVVIVLGGRLLRGG